MADPALRRLQRFVQGVVVDPGETGSAAARAARRELRGATPEDVLRPSRDAVGGGADRDLSGDVPPPDARGARGRLPRPRARSRPGRIRGLRLRLRRPAPVAELHAQPARRPRSRSTSRARTGRAGGSSRISHDSSAPSPRSSTPSPRLRRRHASRRPVPPRRSAPRRRWLSSRSAIPSGRTSTPCAKDARPGDGRAHASRRRSSSGAASPSGGWISRRARSRSSRRSRPAARSPPRSTGFRPAIAATSPPARSPRSSGRSSANGFSFRPMVHLDQRFPTAPDLRCRRGEGRC